MGVVMSTLGPGGRRYQPPPDRHRPGARVLVIDNYDSFTFNLVQYLLELGAVVDVYRNDAITSAQVLADGPSHLLLSPGPGRPRDSGVCQALCAAVCDPQRPPLPTLGVCLGHQTLCEVRGATVERAARIMHGKRSPIIHAGAGVYAGLPSPYAATRYHSLIVDEATLNDPPLQETGVQNLWMLPSGPQPPNPTDLLGSQKMEQAIAALKDRADMVIFDAPPVVSVTDAVVLGTKVDGVLLIVSAGRTRREHTQRAKELLERGHIRIVGTVLNNAPRGITLGGY